MKNKILILGDGLLGTELHTQSGYEVISRKKDGFDITDIKTYQNLLKIEHGVIQYCPYDVIINCIANTDTYSDDREGHWNVNYKGTYDLIDFCNKWQIKLVHISTDHVYANSRSNALETDVPIHSENWYGYTKLLADGLIQLQCKNYLLCRCTHKPTPFPYETAWIDQIGNFDYVDKISNLIIQLIEKDVSGIYNVGTGLKSIYELASKTKDILPSQKPISAPGNTTMDIRKMKSELGI